MSINPDDWYSLNDLPAGTVHVRLRWDCYQVPAVSTVDGKGRRNWHEVRGRQLVPINPMASSVARDGRAPLANPLPTPCQPPAVAWQPLTSHWQWPNNQIPNPLPISVMGSVTSIGGIAFDAASAAEEMERDRDEARSSHDKEPAGDGGQWWRDVARVVYEPRGNVSREMGEARIMRALILERSIRMDIAPYRTNAAVLASLKLTLADVLAEVPSLDWIPLLAPMPEDWRDFEVVMGWLVEVLPSRRELFVLRARMLSPPATWSQIGDEIKRTSSRARQIYDETVDGLIGAANREPRRALARRAELQERNRRARGA